MRDLIIGLDFGSDSARAILVDAADGTLLASSSMAYPRWKQGLYCNPSLSQYRQHPSDYKEVLKHIVTQVVYAVPSDAAVRAIGVDTTASTPCLLDENMQFISDDDPDAMFVLWKDHTGIAESECLSSVFKDYLSHCGGTYSAENFWSKILHIIRTNPRVASRAHYAIEQSDYIPYLLTGKWLQGRCAAASKYMWDPDYLLPPAELFAGVHPVMGRIAGNMSQQTFCASEQCGHLTDEWASALGLDTDVVVSVGNVDAHSGAVGAGCNKDVMVMNLGTSACVMAVGEHQSPVEGVFGQAEDIIVPGLEGYELGLSSFGDNYSWASRIFSMSIPELTAQASEYTVNDQMPLCTDWLNGRRTPKPSPSESSTFLGVRMSTTAAQLFWSIVEGTCFGIRAIVEHMERHGVCAGRIVAVGGISRKSPFVMQMLSNVLQRKIFVSASEESCALGAAMNAAVACGRYHTLPQAQEAMSRGFLVVYYPDASMNHDARYEKYKQLQ